MKWQALKYKNRFLFFREEIDFCQKQHAATQHLFLLDFKSFQEESFSKLAHLDTTARSMERKKRVLFKKSLCIVNRIKGDGECHLSLSLMSPGHSCVASTGEKEFIFPALPETQLGDFLYHTISRPHVHSAAALEPHCCVPRCSPLPCEAWQHPRESWILTDSPLLCLHQPPSPSQPWDLGLSPKTLMLCLIPDSNSASLPVSLSMIPSGTETLCPPLFLFPLPLFLGHSLHALLIQITVAFKTKECRTPGHSTRERRLDECLMETPLSPAAGHGLRVPALTGSRTQGRPHSTPLSTSSPGKGAKREGET